jgi:phenylpropionate dioxygenase-like ring-hydroxylating dioxygenase large terminal subunit
MAVPAPLPQQFPTYPVSWYWFGRSRELRRGPVSRDLCGRRVVAFRTASGRVCVLDARCSHLGADLGRGRVVDEAIQCPFHQWEYGPDGRCVRIPVASEAPTTARQAVFPVVERHGFVFVFNGPEPLFPLPFFFGARPEDFLPARPFGTLLNCPWYLIGANAFDLQHFRAAHDRRLVGEPVVDCPHPFARRASARFTVAGRSLQDRVTRFFAGDEVEMAITDWCGNLMFATATFRRGRSYGMVVTEPRAAGQVLVQVIVFVPRSHSVLGRVVWDPLIRSIRRFFIKEFLSSDAARLDGTRYNPHGLIDYDQDLAAYLWWLMDVSQGRLPPDRPGRVGAGDHHEPAAPDARPPLEPGPIAK